MPELTQNQIADLRALEDRYRSLGADLVIIGAIAYQVHFPREDRHTGGEVHLSHSGCGSVSFVAESA
jgi:hypothetical protein